MSDHSDGSGQSDQMTQSNNHLNTCSACFEEDCDWQWRSPELTGHYCIECVARAIRDAILDPAEPWPPRTENVSVPVEQFADRLNAL